MLFLLAISAIFYYLYTRNIFHFHDKYQEKVNMYKNKIMFWNSWGSDTTKQPFVSGIIVKEVPSWCTRQIIQEKDSVLSPLYHERVDYDFVNDCCIDIIQGFSCKKNETTEVRYCFSGNTNSEIIFIEVKGIRQDVKQAIEIINDVNRQYIPEISEKCGLDKTTISSVGGG